MPAGFSYLLLSELDLLLDLKRWQNTYPVAMADTEMYGFVTSSRKLIEVMDSITPAPTNPATRRDLFHIYTSCFS
jgi:hypothetical protein